MEKLLTRFSTRELRLILGGVVLMVVAAVVSYAVIPQYKSLDAARKSLRALKNLPDSGDASEQVIAMSGIVEGLEHAIHGEAGALPARELEAYMIGKLQAISWDHAVELSSVRPTQRTRVSGFWETPFEIEISGDYLSLFNWMSDIREQIGFVVIKDFRLTPVRNNGEQKLLQASMTIASYQRS